MIFGYVWIFFTMQFVSSEAQAEDTSETEPILLWSTTGGSSKESPSSCEINLVAADDDQQSLDVDEHSSLVNTDQPQCRICLDTGGEDLIAPCHCRGTQKYVHRSCLDNWRATKEGFAFAHCTECRAVFILRANVPPDRWWLRLKFQLLVIRDHAIIFVVVQLVLETKPPELFVAAGSGRNRGPGMEGLGKDGSKFCVGTKDFLVLDRDQPSQSKVVALLGMLVYKFYGEELREMFGYEEHPYGFYSMAILAVILVGLLYGFFIAIICGQRINERHYHVLAKQELTKEYVVESRDENKNLPELDPSHVTELRMMGLY